ncbi:acyl-CoA dehydrogenase family protein [Streptomyces chrestomyceticus]|uniref:acyl-CoA dehydrogenase family protein n=1 Tax=Streptomyces chrestomyceticus TaxID=68185 RepID=UPI0033D413E8
MPDAEQSRLHDAGLANWWLPADCGGPGLSMEASVDIVSELAYADAGTAFTRFISILPSTMVALYGSAQLRQDVLRPLVQDGGHCATLASEHDAGSELLRTATVATRSGGDLVLTGEKSFSTNAEFADYLVVIATGPDDGSYLAAVVPRHTPGVHVVKRWDLVGLRSCGTYQISLRDCRVPAGNALHGNGLRILEVGLNTSRLLVASSAVGMARRIRNLCMDYAAEKQVKGAALAAHPVFAAKLGQMETTICAMLSQCRAAARDYDRLAASPDPGAALLRVGSLKSVLVAKMFCGQAGRQIADIGSQMFGGLGYTNEHPIGKIIQDMAYASLVEGGDDVLRELMYARHVVPPGQRA